ncbi:MAG: alpha/beta hydrolase [Thermaerobacter sp.]|nr:alpha/beta hydrolase [Thermaerobacter sp.]
METTREWRIHTRDGAELEARWWPGGPTTVLLCHGFRFDLESFTGFAGMLADQGYSALAINFRGYGRSTVGEAGPEAWALDVAAAAERIRDEGRAVVALGGSRGAGAVLTAGASHPGWRALITWSTVPVEPTVARQLGPYPKLLVVSREESLHQATLDVYRAAPEPKTLVEFDGDRHAQNIWFGPDRQALEAVVLKFLRELPASAG